MSNLFKEKCSLAKLREKPEGRRGKLCRCCKGFGHLAQNCRNRKEGEEGAIVPQNKFEVLRSRIMQCEEEGRTIRRVGMVEVECFKCGKKGHKCRECPLWVKKEKTAHMTKSQKVQQKELACPIKGKAQERRLRRAEKEEVAHVARS